VPTPARTLAFQILREVDGGGVTLAEAMARPEAEALPSRERAFLHELVLGTLRHRGDLDYALTPLLDRPLAKVHAPLRVVLRMGAHQILHLRVPDRAAVAESVELARRAKPFGTGFVNAVLRRLAREGAPPPPDPVEDPAGWLTSAGSLPGWLAERWTRTLGAEGAVARARAFLDTPKASFRFNPRAPDARARAEQAGLLFTPGLVPEALSATEGRPGELQTEGLVYVQDEGSQLVARLAAGQGTRLDACAAPGGKALLMADLAAGTGKVVAAEASTRRLATMKTLASRWGAANLRLVAADGLRPPFRRGFAAVLLDAPCSGLGTLGRHPDIRWRARPADLVPHAARQRALLERLAALVDGGGLLVYSVCSTEPEETSGVVRPFLAAHPEFLLDPLPTWALPFAEEGFARTAPELHGGDAFFAATLRRGSG
jgi:16S rRNA (cytosine967-C5)-methyltransferase